MNMELNSKHYFEGRKVRKSMDKSARKEAKALIAGTLGEGTPDLADARAIMETYYWMKPKHIDSLIIEKQPLRGWVVLLTFKDLPRGIPNVLGAPGKPKTEADAKFEAERLLRAAYVKCEDTKAMMRAGEMDDLRLFRYQEIFLQVPGEMVDSVAKKTKPPESNKETQKLRQEQIDRIHGILGKHTADVAAWDKLEEDQQINVMIAAAHLLCLNINLVA
jgi:hypothetical protein